MFELTWGLHYICRLVFVWWPFFSKWIVIHEQERSFHLLISSSIISWETCWPFSYTTFLFFYFFISGFVLFFCFLIFSLFTFQMLAPFLVSPQKITNLLYPSSCSPAHTVLLPGPGITLYWGIEPSQDQGSLFPLMTSLVILCCICMSPTICFF